jgi:hypothetical protein
MDVTASSGGTVAISDGTSVAVPANALGQDTPISVGPETNGVTIDGVTMVGDVYRFGPEGTQFMVPATVTLAFDPSLLPSDAVTTDIVILTAPVGSTDFVELPTSLVDAHHASATTMHFSDFVAGVRKKDKNADMSQPQSTSDMSAAQDLSTSAQDLSSPPDLVGTCPHNFAAMTCTMTTGGATGSICSYGQTLNCQQTFCTCQGANQFKMCQKAGADYMTTNCPGQAAMDTMWTSCCGFP